MCGICGKIQLNGQPVDRQLIEKMNSALSHRGPDADGILTDHCIINGVALSVGLGHKRLSIIDLSAAGRQPMSNEDQSVWMVFNGEIYNHAALSARLKRQGHRFCSNTDGETIIHLYEEKGIGCLADLNGMFSFALWDKRIQTIYLVRDRLGIKPLVYSFDGTTLTFASEIKSLLKDPSITKDIDQQALESYLTFNYIPAPSSIFSRIKKLEPGSFLKLAQGRISIERYWDIPRGQPVAKDSDYPVYQKRLSSLLEEAVGLQMMADVPLGAFLSGGIDSSLIVALMARQSAQPIRTFSIGFDDMPMFDETDFARQVARRYRTEHHEIKISPRDVLGAAADIFHSFDEPFADSSAIPSFIISRETVRHVKVALSGDGGDELFAGYRMYAGEYWLRRYQKIPALLRRGIFEPLVNILPQARDSAVLEQVRRVKKFVKGSNGDMVQRYLLWNEVVPQALRRELLQQSPADYLHPLLSSLHHLDGDTINRMLYTDVRHSLPGDMLTKVDWMSMRHSLEVRVPLLDHRVVELAFEMPSRWKIRQGRGKHILRETFKDLLPATVLSRPKWGFEIPISRWLKSDLKFLLDEHLAGPALDRHKIFNRVAVARLVDEHLRGRQDHGWILWNLIAFQAWYGRLLASNSS